MLEKVLNKGGLAKLVVFLLIASIVIITISILTSSDDGRRQIIDKDGGSEEQLCSILTSIKGVGDVKVKVEYGEKNRVLGVIVTAEGASNPVVANDITKGVSTLYNIPVSSVIVFEKEQEESH